MRPPRRVLVIARGHIGDLIQATPALRAVRTAWPDARVTVLANEYTRGLLDGCPYVDAVIHGFAYAERGPWRRRLDGLRLLARLAGRFDAVIALRYAPPQTPLLGLVAGARIRAGYDQPGRLGRTLTHRAGPQPREVSNRLLNLAPLTRLGLGTDPSYEPLTWGGPAVSAATTRLLADAGVGDRYAVFQVSCNWGCNELRRDKWAALAERVWVEHGLTTVLVGVDDEFERAAAADVRSLAAVPVVSLHGRTSLPELFEVVRRAALVVAPDSALTQVALAQRTPAVILFGIEPAVENAPLPDELDRVVVLQHWPGPDRAPAPNPHCRFHHSYCHTEHCRENSSLAQTSVDEIMAATHRALGTNTSRSDDATATAPPSGRDAHHSDIWAVSVPIPGRRPPRS